MPTNWNAYPSKQPAARRAWRQGRRATIEAAATRSWSRLWRKAGGKHRSALATGAELVALWHSQNGRCGLTGIALSPDNAHLDHIIPRSKGGGHTIDNLRWTSPEANRAKGASSDDEFFRWLDVVLFHRLTR